jgi:diguanylate cyclase (GGDEF)-like protein/PAS domain S-box-containing protein
MANSDISVPFKSLVCQGAAGVFYTLANGYCIYINPALETIMDITSAEAEGEGWSSRIHPEDKDQVVNEWRLQVQESKPFNIQCRFMLPNGDIKHITAKANPVLDEHNAIQGYVGHVEDITQRILAKQRLNESESWSFSIIEQSRTPMAVRAVNNEDIVYVNPAFTSAFGYTQSDIPTVDKWNQCAYPDSGYRIYVLNIWNQKLDYLKSDPEYIEPLESTITCKDGSIKHVLLSPFIVKTQDGIQYAASLQDITELKHAEASIKDNEERFALAVRGSGVGIWDWDIRTDTVFFAKELKDELGYADDEFPNVLSSFFNHLHPEDVPTVQACLKAHFSHRNIPYRVQYRLLRKDGSYQWYEAVGEALKDSQGRAYRMAGSHQNITKRITAEENLNLSNLVFENSGEAIIVTSQEGYVERVNPAFCLITGYEEGEILHQPYYKLGSRKSKAEVIESFLFSLEEKGFWSGEVWAKRKNGESFAISIIVNSIKDNEGNILKYIGSFTDITDKKQTQELIWQQAHYDSLTQLLNRNSFTQYLNNAVKLDNPFALLFIDLDHFKQVNDTLGHKTGDELLQQAAARLKHCVRGSDIVSRFGGDEFTIILSSVDNEVNISRICHEIIHQLAKPFKLKEEQAYISASIGITQYPTDSREVEDLYKFADQAMYDAKHAGRNRFAFFTQALQEKADTQRKISSDLRVAIEKNQFNLLYQPIVSLKDNRIQKAEALIRWTHPERGSISPADFIPIAEDNGLIIEIGDWVFKQAAMQVKVWQKHYNPDFQISINKSPVQFYNGDSRMQENWSQFLDTINLSGKSITVEITEGLLLDGVAVVKDKLTDFHNTGIEISLDDFGTGYSALGYLKKFDIDYIKIDQSFVKNIEHDAYDLILCETIISMSHKLGKKVIAEGIENENQKSLLIEAGCDYGQGYLFSKPIDAQDLTTLLRDQASITQ